MALFQDKIGWKRLRNRKNINYRSVPFLHNAQEEIPKNSKKNRKTKQYHYGFILSQNWLENAEKEKK